MQTLLLAPLEAAGVGLATFVSQNYGAWRFDRIRQGVRQSTVVFLAYCALAYGANYFFGASIAELFVARGETAVHQLIQQLLRINSYFFVSITLVYLSLYTIQGLGFSPVVMATDILKPWAAWWPGLCCWRPGLTAIRPPLGLDLGRPVLAPRVFSYHPKAGEGPQPPVAGPKSAQGKEGPPALDAIPPFLQNALPLARESISACPVNGPAKEQGPPRR